MCEASVYAFIDEIRQGFLTLKGGHRVGITGRVIMDRGEISNITYISSLNIRVAKEIKGVADNIIDKIKHHNTLIISPPNAGKTTLLRDITRLLGQEAKVGLADERGEIAASLFGAPSYDIGQNTDCYDLCRKSVAVGMLVRAMSPEYVVVDEIATKADTKAIQDATSLGVHVIASSHGHDYDDILKRMPRIKGIFDKIIILKRQGGEFQKEVLDV
jgi:stage III sporulation protein AA